uniref:Uncharacterized protein n=1 Tax=Setaria viridis TaxID=4556 RepID=A0A4U6UHQ9_SETVI|nr:hypothetical protein SEVIR_5G247700v2 [Setaria viridis]
MSTRSKFPKVNCTWNSLKCCSDEREFSTLRQAIRNCCADLSSKVTRRLAAVQRGAWEPGPKSSTGQLAENNGTKMARVSSRATLNLVMGRMLICLLHPAGFVPFVPRTTPTKLSNNTKPTSVTLALSSNAQHRMKPRARNKP